jgi:hypothetical protein
MSLSEVRRLQRLGLLAVWMALGCSGKSASQAEVEGTVTWSGSALENVLVEFLADEGTGATAPRSAGVTDANGHFVLLATNGRPGVAEGKYRIVLTRGGRSGAGGDTRRPRLDKSRPLSPGDADPAVDPAVLAAYGSWSRTPLRQQVLPGKQTVTLSLP